MEAKPRRRRDPFDRAPSGLVDPRRSDPLNDPLNPRSKRTDRPRYATKTFARVTRPTLCYTCDGHCTRTSLDPPTELFGTIAASQGAQFCVASRRRRVLERRPNDTEADPIIRREPFPCP